MDDARRIVATDEVPTDGTLLVTLRDGTDTTEAILTRLADGVVAFRNSCPHWTDVRLDRGSGALVRGEELVCQKHGATFERETGFCDFGPCEGAMLDRIGVEASDGDVYLTDDDYEFDSLGADGDRDLSSGSRIDF
ncbi:Rieske (2Fe-2S) protein [Salinirubrum litoreum]|uniref:Rieske (2Fe-2S) protein n=1 Tax=Salinirubrum litoreum TaxID=1126234 RepID=A0ABD5R6M8_9EURY|nr:Rieske 2Fe-2S domain-containing protein [Salinirubrum litoreum]